MAPVLALGANFLINLAKTHASDFIGLLKKNKRSKEMIQLALIHQEKSEKTLRAIVENLDKIIKDTEGDEITIRKSDLEIHNMQLAMVVDDIDWNGDLLRGYDDDAPSVSN